MKKPYEIKLVKISPTGTRTHRTIRVVNAFECYARMLQLVPEIGSTVALMRHSGFVPTAYSITCIGTNDWTINERSITSRSLNIGG